MKQSPVHPTSPVEEAIEISQAVPSVDVDSSDEEVLQAALQDAFDADYYLKRYADVAVANRDPFDHYMRHGWRENRSPLPEFDGAYYREKYLGEGHEEMSPLAHYVLEGRAHSLPTSREEELQRFGDRDWSGLVFNFLKAAGLDVSHIDKDVFHRFILPMFSAQDYKQRKSIPVNMSETQLLAQYLAFDFLSGISPGPLFDADWYVLQAQKAGLPPVTQEHGPFLHWLEHGVANRIVPLSLFCEETYLAMNPDVARIYKGWPFEHFLHCGLAEERCFSQFIRFNDTATRPLLALGATRTEELISWAAKHPSVTQRIEEMSAFLKSDLMADILRSAAALEPEIGKSAANLYPLMPPWQDGSYADFKEVRKLIPLDRVERIILMPFCKMGGADFLTGALVHEAGNPAETLVLRTEQSDWVRPDWFPEAATSVDLSRHLNLLDPRSRRRVLYEVIRSLGARHVYNVNSRLGFETLDEYGARMARFTRLYAYYFCSDWTAEGAETGYPVEYFAHVLPHLHAALFDSAALPNRLAARFVLPGSMRSKLHVLHTPVMSTPPNEPVVHRQVASKADRKRPVLLWGGRLDRQKRFDLLLEIAQALPEVEFRCWGRAVLDAPIDDLDTLPDNVTLNPPFERFDELPLRHCDGWIYTSAWDGLPNIVIEAGAYGMPLVASAVDGVPELLDETTGWPVSEVDNVAAYVVAIREMLSSDSKRIARAEALQLRVRERHTRARYRAQLGQLEALGND